MSDRTPQIYCVFVPPEDEDQKRLNDYLTDSNCTVIRVFEGDEYFAFMDGLRSSRGKVH